MSSGMLDSEPVFENRMLAASLLPAEVDLLKAAQLDTLAKFAYAVACQPGVGDDAPFVNLMTQILLPGGGALPAGKIAILRRVWFEANTVALSEVRAKVERTDDTQPKKLPGPERASRLEEQRTRLVGVTISGVTEPSFALLDFINQMKDDDCIKCVDPSICTMRQQEMKGVKRETFFKPDAQGVMRTVIADHHDTADLTTEYRIRLALQRRSLALDQSMLMTYTFSEQYHDFLFQLTTSPVPISHMHVNMHQILKADEYIWMKMSEICRTGISKRLTGEYPMQLAMTEARQDPIVITMLSPLQKPTGKIHPPFVPKFPGLTLDETALPRREPKGKGKGKGKVKTSGADSAATAAPAHTKTPDGRSICKFYNLARGCIRPVCDFIHVCNICLGNHAGHACTAQ